jgi:DNA-binding NtrC family response regulator
LKTLARILVVDDEESLRRVLQVQLENKGYLVSLAAEAQQALSILTKTPHDLVLSDLRMRGLSGIELLHEIRKDDPHIPVILLTAFGTVENAVEAMQADAYSYVLKPVLMDELIIVMERALERRRLIQ